MESDMKTPKWSFETGVYRPPSEGGSHSLLIRLTRNCYWNRCEFCGLYKGKKFQLRSSEKIKSDIDSIATICNSLKRISFELGYGGEINREIASVFLERQPKLIPSDGFVMIYDWLLSGGETAFLQDANSLILQTKKLVDIIIYLRKTFPSLSRVTSYATSKSLFQKSQKDLKEIRNSGLDRLHIGLESGNDIVLERIKKGTTSEEHISGGKKAMKAGFQLSEYWIPGLGGKEMSVDHAKSTARILNEINPDYIRTRPFFPWPGTPLCEAYITGTFHLLTPSEQLAEIGLMIEELSVESKICFDHASNNWRGKQGTLLFSQSYEGYKFPAEKPRVLELIEEGIEIYKGIRDNENQGLY